ncbi:MAG: hypothetical protein M3Q06_10790, partial [Bacteroidota bacterium]|nr:hypothetical protein [Bacteroidota bacterium]
MNQELKPTRLQVFSFVVSMPVIDVVLYYILYGDRLFHDGRIWLISFPLIYLIGVASWRSQIGIQNWIHYKFPGLKQTSRRIFLLAGLIMPVMSASVVIIMHLYDYFAVLG